MGIWQAIGWAVVSSICISAGSFFWTINTQGRRAGHNQFTIKLLPMPKRYAALRKINRNSQSR